MPFLLICFLVLAVSLVTEGTVIVPGATWTDTAGNVIQAHGGGFLKVGSTYYWYGEDKSLNSALFHAVSCYTSTDLTTWTRQNDALTPIAGTNISTSNIVERPKAMVQLSAGLKNNGYREAAQTTYLLYASDNNQNFKISKLDADYYGVLSQTGVLTASTLEAPGIIKRNGIYYLFASHTSGWDPNPNKVFTATSLAGPWSTQADIAPSATRTYFSQNTFDMLINNNLAIYMGDRWRPSLLGSSRYIWFPLSWSTGIPQIVHTDVWSIDLSSGTYTTAAGVSYEAESGTISGSATILSDTSFSGGKAVGYLGDSAWRNTTVSVNGGASVLVDQPNTGGGHVILSVPVKLTLRSGANSITFSAGQSNYAADLDKIIVYTAT
ncbi:hypothetical protein C0995_014193 [Termitomyces sp. Mi166|nr:hypothetical protein C0995_014193 [Termitomyces sp. Mi166\